MSVPDDVEIEQNMKGDVDIIEVDDDDDDEWSVVCLICCDISIIC
jgi:hypothetical protein